MRLPSDFATRLANRRVLVVGDVMLDRYWFGDVDRISPEAPVPVVAVSRVQERLGGAANVALNVRALGAACTLLSVVGRDEAGHRVRELLAERDVTAKLGEDTAAPTTIKLRVIARNQQLIRMDFEEPPGHEVLAEVLADYRQHLPDTGVVVLSDYGKGGLSHIGTLIGLAASQGIPVMVDPKGRDFSRYCGAHTLTPNRQEFAHVVGDWRDDAEFADKALRLVDELRLEQLLITRSEQGMSLFTRAGEGLHVPARAREVYDVSGAGDTVIASMAVALLGQLPVEQAVQLANAAAGVVVGKLGVAAASLAEIAAQLAGTT